MIRQVKRQVGYGIYQCFGSFVKMGYDREAHNDAVPHGKDRRRKEGREAVDDPR